MVAMVCLYVANSASKSVYSYSCCSYILGCEELNTIKFFGIATFYAVDDVLKAFILASVNDDPPLTSDVYL